MATEADLYILSGTGAAGQPIFTPVSSTNPIPTTGTATVTAKTINWNNPGTAVAITASGTVMAAGPTVAIVTNATAAGGGTLTLNLSGGTAVSNQGVPLLPGQSIQIIGQNVTQAITGICSTGTCTVSVQTGS